MPDCNERLRIQGLLGRLVRGTDAPDAAFPGEVNTSLPLVRRLVATATDVTWDIVEAPSSVPVVPCDLARLGAVGQNALASQATGPAGPPTMRGGAVLVFATGWGVGLEMPNNNNMFTTVPCEMNLDYIYKYIKI